MDTDLTRSLETAANVECPVTTDPPPRSHHGGLVFHPCPSVFIRGFVLSHDGLNRAPDNSNP